MCSVGVLTRSRTSVLAFSNDHASELSLSALSSTSRAGARGGFM
jgi:hypothetical protein